MRCLCCIESHLLFIEQSDFGALRYGRLGLGSPDLCPGGTVTVATLVIIMCCHFYWSHRSRRMHPEAVPSLPAGFGWGHRADKRVVDGETGWFFSELPGLNDAPFQLVAVKTEQNIPIQR